MIRFIWSGLLDAQAMKTFQRVVHLVGYTSFRFLGHILLGKHTFSSSTETQPDLSMTLKLKINKYRINRSWTHGTVGQALAPKLGAGHMWSDLEQGRTSSCAIKPEQQIHRRCYEPPSKNWGRPSLHHLFGVFWWLNLKAATTGLQSTSSNEWLYFRTWQISSFPQISVL